MLITILTILLFLSLGAIAVFVFAALLQRRMSKDSKSGKQQPPGVEKSDEWGRGD